MLEMVTAAIRLSPEHGGSGILIAGETGTGKSALIRAALDATDGSSGESQLSALIGCHPSTVPYAPWLTLIESQPEFKESVPVPLGTREPAAQGPDELVHQSARAICQLAATRPVILVFDDIQWADESSLDLILAIARQLDAQPLPLTLILSCETPLREGTPVASFVPALLRETPTQSIEMRALSERGVRDLVDRRYPDADAESVDGLVSHIHRWSGGNPLYISEMIDGLDGNGKLGRDSGRQLGDSLSFSLRQLAEYRLSQVSEDARETLELASIVGDLIDLDLLTDISGFHMDRVIDDLEEALDCGILIEERGDELRFRHGIVRQILAERQSGIRRRQRHRAVLNVLQRLGHARPLDIARHAEAAGEYETAVNSYEQAANHSRTFFNMPEAARNFRRALDLAEQANLSITRQDELRLHFADSIIRTDPSSAAREYERVAARSFIRDDRVTLARARQRQATLLYETGRRHEARSILDDLIPELEDLGSQETLAEALACALYCAASASEFLEVDRFAERLKTLADEMSAPNYRAVAHQMSAVASVAHGNPVGAPLAARDGIAMAVELGQLDIATPWSAVAFFRIDLFANLHRPDEVASLIQRGSELDAESNRRIGLSPGDCDCTPEFSYWWFLRGEWDRVRDVLPDPVAIRSAPQPQVLKDSVQVIAAEWAIARKRVDDALSCLAYVAPSPGTPPGDHGYQQWLMAVEMRVRLAVAAGDLDAAEEWLKALDRELETKPHVPGELMLELGRARLHLAREEADAAGEIAGSVVREARRTQNMLALIDALQLQARSLQLLGDWTQALGVAAEAVVTASQCELGYLQALARITRLEIAHAFGDNSDPVQAETVSLAEKLQEMGALPAAERLKALAPQQPQGYLAGLTRREVEVLHLVAKGKTDNEIAEELFISPRTVGTHVGNMLNKTGTNNRVELATWAHVNQVLD